MSIARPMLRPAALALALAGLAATASCNVLAPVVAVVAGPPKRDAAFVLEERPTVVLVDDRDNRIPLRSGQVRRRIGRTLTSILNTRKDLIPENLIDSTDAIALADARDRSGQLVPAAELARELGAEVIIVVRMEALVFANAGVPRPAAVAAVKVLDAVSRERLFPPADATEDARRVTTQLPQTDPLRLASESGRVAASFELADALAVDIAKLFYRHEIKELGGNLEPR